MDAENIRRFVLMPAEEARDQKIEMGAVLAAASQIGIRMLHNADVKPRSPSPSLSILDVISNHGPRLVELPRETQEQLDHFEGFRLVPVVTYQQARAEKSVRHRAAAKAGETGSTVVTIVDANTKAGVAGATVRAFTNLAERIGVEGVTAADGRVTLDLAPTTRLDCLYVFGPAGYWGHFSRRQKAGQRGLIEIAPLKMQSRSHLLRHIYGAGSLTAGRGVRVAIIDSGVARSHPALPNVTTGANLVFRETQNNPGAIDDWGPARSKGEHGTHVAGIVGARSIGRSTVAGVAPGVEILSYRVFPHSGADAESYDIMKAIYRAVDDGCHIINLSLASAGGDEGVRDAIAHARRAGILVVAAAGNDRRASVSFPAAFPDCIAVTAMGRRRTFPGRSAEAGDIAEQPRGKDPLDFVAAFSNYGDVDLIGPGVGIVSTLPNDTFGVMSGTSMACPAVSGFAARLFAESTAIRDSDPADRVDLWTAALLGRGGLKGFGDTYEGRGLPI